jgi:cardiolipin synthase A/B
VWRTLARVAVVVLIAIAAVLFFLEPDRRLLVESALGAEDPQFPDYAATVVGSPLTRGDAYEILQNGDAIFPSMLEAIERAQRTISFESFIYSTGVVPDRFTVALAGAARRGVAVRIVLDAFGAMDISRDNLDRLAEAGVMVLWFNPIRPMTIQKTNYRTHRKVLVVDGEVAFTGGVGLGDQWLGDARNEDEWRDMQVRVTGPAVRYLEAAFYENWLESGGRVVPAFEERPPSEGTGARSIVIWSNPTGGANDVKLLYLISIAAARRTIDIASPYFILDQTTRWVLDRARERGVRVRLVTEGEITDALSVKRASRAQYDALLERGYEIYEFQPTMMHLKAMVVDETWSLVGSANFDPRSFELNDELTVAIADPSVAATLTRAFEADMARSARLELDTWRERPLRHRASERFWSLFSALF